LHTFHIAHSKVHIPTRILALSFLETPLNQFPKILVVLVGGE
jgi:hypothetical protein